jgi:SAM-dependent methyltransferase
MTDLEKYHEYLMGRSSLGLIYRFRYLYPRIDRNLTGRVLDVGCGIGDFLKFKTGAVGVDINPANVEYCLRRGLDARLMTNGSLPFLERSFDCIVLDNVIEHILDPTSLLTEIERVLRDRGKLVVGVPGRRGFNQDADHKVYYEKEELSELLTPHGFFLVSSFYVPFESKILSAALAQYCLYATFELLR